MSTIRMSKDVPLPTIESPQSRESGLCGRLDAVGAGEILQAEARAVRDTYSLNSVLGATSSEFDPAQN